MEKIVIRVDGMTCGGCVRNVTNVLSALPGVDEAKVSLEDAQVMVRFDPAKVSVAQLKEAITDAGFDCPE